MPFGDSRPLESWCTFMQRQVKSPARTVHASTVLVLSARYLLFLYEIKSQTNVTHNRCCQTKGTRQKKKKFSCLNTNSKAEFSPKDEDFVDKQRNHFQKKSYVCKSIHVRVDKALRLGFIFLEINYSRCVESALWCDVCVLTPAARAARLRSVAALLHYRRRRTSIFADAEAQHSNSAKNRWHGTGSQAQKPNKACFFLFV